MREHQEYVFALYDIRIKLIKVNIKTYFIFTNKTYVFFFPFFLRTAHCMHYSAICAYVLIFSDTHIYFNDCVINAIFHCRYKSSVFISRFRSV